MLIRDKTDGDGGACLELLLRVHAADAYPLYLPDDIARFITPEYESAAWVAEADGVVVGHVALHQAAADPTLDTAMRATGLAAEQLSVVSRLFVEPGLRRSGAGRSLLRTATTWARSRGQRAVLDVGQSLHGPIALYESEGWTRVEALQRELGGKVLDLWVYLSPEEPG